MKKYNRFSSNVHTSPIYTCAICGKETRETGEGESSLELCKNCYIDSMAENEHNDNHSVPVSGCKFCEEENK